MDARQIRKVPRMSFQAIAQEALAQFAEYVVICRESAETAKRMTDMAVKAAERTMAEIERG